MNSEYVIEHLVPENIKTVSGIDFHQKRYLDNGYIKKDISFKVNGESHFYQERVRAFTLQDFETLFSQANCNLLDVFGDYKLRKFDAKTSERLIMIFK